MDETNFEKTLKDMKKVTKMFSEFKIDKVEITGDTYSGLDARNHFEQIAGCRKEMILNREQIENSRAQMILSAKANPSNFVFDCKGNPLMSVQEFERLKELVVKDSINEFRKNMEEKNKDC